MSHDLYTFATTDRIYFKLTLNGVGQAGLTLEDADIKRSVDGGTAVNAGNDCNETSFLLGWYYWTPQAGSETSGDVIILNIKDDSAGGAFDENAVLICTGGHPSARFSG